MSGDVAGLTLLALAAAAAGAVNAIAGGGTILTFPVLAAILPADAGRLVSANATSTIGLWPAAAAAAWTSRGARVGQPAWTRWLLVPSVVGAAVGTLLVLRLPPGWFDAAVPWLILLAAALFALQPQLARWMPTAGADGRTTAPTARLLAACILQFAVGVYGGYFGAGIGILMLAVLGALGLGDIHALNAVKNVLGTAVNGVAAAVFAGGSLTGAHAVSWPHAALVAAAAVAGSLVATHVARRLPATAVRRAVAVSGFALAGYYFWQRLAA